MTCCSPSARLPPALWGVNPGLDQGIAHAAPPSRGEPSAGPLPRPFPEDLTAA
jgi:hypothetical protein